MNVVGTPSTQPNPKLHGPKRDLRGKLVGEGAFNHAFPIKHLYRDYVLMKRFLSRGFNKGGHGKDPEPTTDDTEGRDGCFLTLDDCLMIFGGSAAYDSRRRQKLAHHEVYTAKLTMPSFL